jgi:integrase
VNDTETDFRPVAARHAGQFTAVRDSRNRKVPGLQVRNGRFYGVLWTRKDDGRMGTRRFPLLDANREPCRTLTAAKEAFEIKKHERREGNLPADGRKPGMEKAVQEYLTSTTHTGKAANTQAKESRSLELWWRFLGETTRVDTISKQMISGFKNRRLSGGKIGGKDLKPAHWRTVENDLIALRNFLTYADEEGGWIKKKPEFPAWRQGSRPPKEQRPLIPLDKFYRLIEVCRERHPHSKDAGADVLNIKNGDQLADFLLLLAYCGAREQEGLKLRWNHVDFVNRRLYIGAGEDFVAGAVVLGEGGDTKTGRGRVVHFIPQLEAHLKDMASRRAPDSKWLFPSPRRGKKDVRVMTLRSALDTAKSRAKVARFGFHDCRHLFASYAIMSGRPIMTVAKWLGHRDKGKLVMDTYGHLLDDFLQKEADQVQIGLTVVPFSSATEQKSEKTVTAVTA